MKFPPRPAGWGDGCWQKYQVPGMAEHVGEVQERLFGDTEVGLSLGPPAG